MKYSCTVTKKVVGLLGVLLAIGLICFTSVPAKAQVSGATLSGTVTDASGAAVPNATVSIKNTGTTITKDITTDAAGFYSAPNLPPAVYDVTVSATGFTSLSRTGITLTVGGQQTLNVSLKVGQVAETVTVTGEAPQVQLTSSALSGEVNETTVRELPLNGRDWTSLSELEPGVLGIRTQQSTTGTVSRGNRGFGNQLTVSGHRPVENNYRVNGITVNDYSNGSPGSVQGSQLGVDAIQEFSVLTANYTAEYGRTSGGVINSITKAGTNTFHGDAYWFLRDNRLDARNTFDPSNHAAPPFHRNQFGGSAGGPIQKGKTFVFGDFEAIRQDKTLSANSTVPTAAARAGNLCSTIAPTAVCPDNGQLGPQTITVDSAVVPYLALFPLPSPNTQPSATGDTGQFLYGQAQTFSENYVTSRVDHHFSDKDDIDALFFYDNGPQYTPDVLGISTAETKSTRIMGGIEETHSFSSALVNTARVGYNRTVGFVGVPGQAISPLASDTSLSAGFLPGRPAPIITNTGLVTMQGTLGDQTQNLHYDNDFQFYDDAFYTHGNHSIKFGFSVERIQYNELNVQRPNGTFGFQGSLISLLQNQPLFFQQGDSGVEKKLGTRDTFFGGYVQDDWKLRPNLTINLGLRYEFATLPTEAHYGFTVVPSISAAPVNQANPWTHNPTTRGFQPRIGFAYDPFGDGKTSIRGGFGIFDVLPGPWIINVQESGAYPFALTATFSNLPAGTFPALTGVDTSLTNAIAHAQAYGPEQNPKLNYAMNWNLTIQRQITPTLTATIGYVGSHTIHSPMTTDTSNSVGFNNGQVQVTPYGLMWPCGPSGSNPCAVNTLPSGAGTTTYNSFVGQLRPTFWDTSSRYNGLQAQLTKNFSHGLQGQASFTWSNCVDNASGGDIGDPFSNSYSSLM
ncbi:MAG: TonB-dependent receptor domain-containing protein, partial [Candidatus Acidiferrales bacterium]